MPSYNSNDPYRPLFGSLSDQKSLALAEKYKQKKATLEPSQVREPTGLDLQGDDQESSYVGDLTRAAGASLLGAGGSLADFGRNVSNRALDTNFDDSQATGWSNPDVADAATGVPEAYRQNVEQGQQQVMSDVVEGNYGDAALSAAKIAIPTAVDSVSSLVELGVGALATAAGGAGAPVLAKKAVDVFSTGKKIKKSYDKAKALKEATRLGKLVRGLPAATAKTAGQASILAADMTQQTAATFEETNPGEKMSDERLATSFLGNLATSMIEPALITNLFIPNFKKEIGKEIMGAAKNLGKGSNFVNIGKRVGDSAAKLFAAGAGEAGQEYLQTWWESLVTEISPEEADNLRQAVLSKFSDKDLQNKAIVGGILGGAAGGATRGAISVPADVAGAGLDLTKATGKGAVKVAVGTANIAGKVAQHYGNKAGMKLLSPEEQARVAEDYETRNEIFKEKVAEIDGYVKTVNETGSFADLVANPDLADVANMAQEDLNMTDAELAKPKNFAKLKDKITRRFKAAEVQLDIELKATTVGQVGKQAGQNIAKGTKKVVKDVVESEQVAKVVKGVEAYGTAAIEAVQDVRSSTGLGVIELGLEGTKESSRKAYMKAKKANLRDIQKAVVALEGPNKPLSKQLESLVKQKKRFQGKLGITSDDLVTDVNLSPVLKAVNVEGKISEKDANSVASAIKTAIAGRISDKASLAKIKNAVAIYKDTAHYKDKMPGHIRPNNMKVLERTLANTEKRLGRELTEENLGEALDKTVEGIGKASKKFRKATKRASVKTQRAFRDIKESDTAKTITDAAGKVVDAVEEFAEDTADKIDAKIATNAEIANNRQKLGDNLEKIAPLLDDPATAIGVAENMPAIVQAMVNAGVDTQAKLDGLIKEYEFLGQDPTFRAKLQSQFDETTQTAKETDVVMTQDKINPEEDTKTEDGKLVTMFKTMIGCNAK